MSLFWKNDYEPTIIQEDIDYDKLNRWLLTNNIEGLNAQGNLSEKWASFCQYYGRKNGLGYIESGSFSYIMSIIMGDFGISCGTDVYFDEERIDTDVINKLNELHREDNLTEEEKVIEIFNYVFKLYDERISDFEFKTKRLEFRVTQRQYNKFMKLKGDNKTDKFVNLLNTVK